MTTIPSAARDLDDQLRRRRGQRGQRGAEQRGVEDHEIGNEVGGAVVTQHPDRLAHGQGFGRLPIEGSAQAADLAAVFV